jgi:hypothetical protein
MNLSTGQTSYFSYADFMDWRDNRVFAQVAAFQDVDMDLTGAGDPVRVKAAAVTPQFFAALGVSPSAGRTLGPSDYPFDAPRAVVISDRLWKTQFGARADIAGQTAEINGIKRPIVGVLPTRRPLAERNRCVGAASSDIRAGSQSAAARQFPLSGRCPSQARLDDREHARRHGRAGATRQRRRAEHP